ncbi:MAG: DnaJ C-terminal domain-containing protein [Pseudomonadota bacterium]
MDFKDYYKTLDVATDADLKTIKTAYRRLARKYHPDVSTEHDAEKQFKEVSEAYEVLSDDKKRAEYDELRQYGRSGQSFEPPPGWQRSGRQENQSSGNADFSDFFENIFGGGRFHQNAGTGGQAFDGSEDFGSSRGRDIEVEWPLLLEETLSDESRSIEYHLPHYSETGRQPDIRKSLKVKIPAGVADGERIRIKGQGAPGFGNGPAGDLYLRVRLVPHPLFDVSGHDLTITVPVTPWEAALGTSITVPTLTGKISLKLAANSQSGQRLRIKERGLKTKTGHGDLFALLKVVMPPSTDNETRELWQTLASKAGFNPRKDWEV